MINYKGSEEECSAGRFEIHLSERNPQLEEDLTLLLEGGNFHIEERTWSDQEDKSIVYIFDVSDPELMGPQAKELADNAVRLTGQPVYFGWQTFTGWLRSQ